MCVVKAAWAEAEQGVVELTHTRSRTEELRNDLRVLLNEETMLLDDQDQFKQYATHLHTSPISVSATPLHLPPHKFIPLMKM